MTKNQGVWVRRLRFLAQLAKAFCPGSDDRRALRKFARFDPTPEAGARSFLFLQGPQSPFMRRLGLAMHSLGVKVLRINVCGGDVYHWPRPLTLCYRGSRLDWPAFVATVMDRHGVTDLILIGDKRPLNHDAICLARARGIAVHVLEEGYLRPSYITMERGGVNSNSSLPPTPEAVRALAATLPDLPRPSRIVDSMSVRVVSTIKHHVGNTVLFGFFPRYRTHRPYAIGVELTGWLPRYFSRKRRRRRAETTVAGLFASGRPFFLFPLQLDSDMQVRSYSHFGVLDSIMHVLSSFARGAPDDCVLLVKNHPLDNGLINLSRYLNNFARAAGIADRIIYIDGGAGRPIMEHEQCRGVVVVNSTMALEAMALGRPVYSLGRAPYAMPGLAVAPAEMSLEAFWTDPRPVDMDLLVDFVKVLHERALLPGNFYTDVGIAAAVAGILRRLGLAVPCPGEEHPWT